MTCICVQPALCIIPAYSIDCQAPTPLPPTTSLLCPAQGCRQRDADGRRGEQRHRDCARPQGRQREWGWGSGMVPQGCWLYVVRGGKTSAAAKMPSFTYTYNKRAFRPLFLPFCHTPDAPDSAHPLAPTEHHPHHRRRAAAPQQRHRRGAPPQPPGSPAVLRWRRAKLELALSLS